MQHVLNAGLAVAAVGLAGYGVGLVTPYPGRSFSVTAVMVGVALAAAGMDGGARS